MTVIVNRVRSTLLIGFCILITVLGIGFCFQLLFTAAKSSCFQEGPFSSAAVMSERSDSVTESIVPWPLGRSCQWERKDGAGVVTTYSGTLTTSFAAYGSILIGVSGAIAGSSRIKARQGGRP